MNSFDFYIVSEKWVQQIKDIMGQQMGLVDIKCNAKIFVNKNAHFFNSEYTSI